MKRAVCSEVPEFAAYFRQPFPEVRGKTKIDRPDPCFRHPRPAVFVGKNRVTPGVFRFFPALPKLRPFIVGSSINNGIRDNIQLSQKRQRAVAGKPNNDPSLSPPHIESTATASLRISYRNFKQPNKATIGNASVRHQFQSKYN